MHMQEYGKERLEYENLRKAQFFQDHACKEMYKAHATTVGGV